MGYGARARTGRKAEYGMVIGSKGEHDVFEPSS
jgi:hypothetical protein